MKYLSITIQRNQKGFIVINFLYNYTKKPEGVYRHEVPLYNYTKKPEGVYRHEVPLYNYTKKPEGVYRHKVPL